MSKKKELLILGTDGNAELVVEMQRKQHLSKTLQTWPELVSQGGQPTQFPTQVKCQHCKNAVSSSFLNVDRLFYSNFTSE